MIPNDNFSFVVLPPEIEIAARSENSLGMNLYQRVAKQTDQMPEGLKMPFLGLFGEVGSLLSALKKKLRDKAAFTKYDSIILEELGDVLWYFSNIATRVNIDLSTLAKSMFCNHNNWNEIKSYELDTFSDVDKLGLSNITSAEFGQTLVELAGNVGNLVNDYSGGKLEKKNDKISVHLVVIFLALHSAAKAAEVGLGDAAYANLRKTFSRWPIKIHYPPLIDENQPQDEKLPRQYTIYFEEQTLCNRTFVIQKCNNIIIGDRLTDNKIEKDDYRFHDVFHNAFAVHLGWSPVLRALFHLKRKSIPEVDENQDGARAMLIEEGVSTFIFSHGLERGLFKDINHVDYDLLKSIQEMIKGYEVERCALWQWEKAILDGFQVFRALTKYRRGYVISDIEKHSLEFKKKEEYES